MPLVSILVPVYNVEKYLERCISSVLNQDFTDYEIIMVDDGSTDNSSFLCDKLCNKNPEKIKVIHKKNEGLPSARLEGFKNSSGKYIIFLDSDDYLLENAISTFVFHIEQGYDIVRCRILREDTITKERWVETYSNKNPVLDSNISFLENIIKSNIPPYLHSGIYNRTVIKCQIFELLKNNQINIGEDWYTNIYLGYNVNKYKEIDYTLYCYSVNHSSLMFNEKKFNKADMKKSFLLLNEISKSFPSKIKDLLIANRISATIRNFFIPGYGFDDDSYLLAINYLNEEKNNILRIKEFLNNRYLYFIKRRNLFYIYSRIYCLLYKKFRLKQYRK